MALITNVLNHIVTPEKFDLSQNDPNPFKGKTSIKYSVPYKSKVIFMINNYEGHIVDRISIKKQGIGLYEIEFYADGLPAGTYFYHLIADDFYISKEMELIK